MRRRLFFAAAILVAGASWIIAQNINENIHPPLRSPTKHIPYDPERIIRTTLHEYKREGPREEHETTGRYTTFGLPMKYLDLSTVYDEETPVFFRTYTQWVKGEDGEFSIASVHAADGAAPRFYANSNRFRVHLSHFGTSNSYDLRDQIEAAHRENATFRGYKPGALKREVFMLNETHCGFELFEREYARRWHREAGRIEGVAPPETIISPFERARVFALPDGEGGYRRIVECISSGRSITGLCRADVELNNYIVARYSFDGSLLCQIDDVITAHQDLLRKSVIDAR